MYIIIYIYIYIYNITTSTFRFLYNNLSYIPECRGCVGGKCWKERYIREIVPQSRKYLANNGRAPKNSKFRAQSSEGSSESTNKLVSSAARDCVCCECARECYYIFIEFVFVMHQIVIH